MKLTLLSCFGLILIAGCAPSNPSPDQIREKTAQATHDAVQDAKAMTQGVMDGIKSSRTVNINTASTDKLKALPGVDEALARRIVANRPYEQPDDLVKKRVVSRAEYERIVEQVKTN